MSASRLEHLFDGNLGSVGLIWQGLEVAGVMNSSKKQRRQIASMTDLRLVVF